VVEGAATVKGRWLRMGGLAILLAAFALRAWRLDFQELRGDEAFGYFLSLRPYGEIISATFALQEPHPVAGYFVQKAWLEWAGHSEFALRFVSLWFGVLAVALVVRLGFRLELPLSAALVAGALMALSPYGVWHSQDARMYSLSLALTLASTWLAVEWLQRRGSQETLAWAVAYLAVSWLALHTHYFNLFVLVAQSLVVLTYTFLHRRLWRTLFAWASLQLILALIYLPWLLPALPTLMGYGGNGDSPGFGALLGRSLSVFAVGESVPAGQRPGWAILALLLLWLGGLQLWMEGPNGRRALWLLAFYLCIPLLATWYSAQQRPIFNERYLIAAAPPFYLLIAMAVYFTSQSLIRPRTQSPNLSISLLAWALLLLLLTGMSFSLHRHYTDPAYSKTRGWRELATRIEQLTAQFPPDQVRLVQNFPDPTLWYYYQGSVEHVVLPPAPHDPNGATEAVARLAGTGVQRVVLPVQPAPNWDDERIAPSALAERYTLAVTEQVGVWPLELYALAPAVLTPQAVEFQNGVELAGYALQPSVLAAGDYLVIYLSWTGDPSQMSGTEKVFVQLLNRGGQLVAQNDRPLTLTRPGSVLTSPAIYAILLPEGLPAGEYQLIAGLYDPAQEGAPRVLTVTGLDFVGLTNIPTVDKQ
jgi:4-amino-4-deoxy-L-arabinose transferase-like glycosyltransferase